MRRRNILFKRPLKSTMGRTKILLVLGILMLSSTLVVAANSSITGSFLAMQSSENYAEVEVWANTSLTFVNEQNIAKVQLLMDNGTALEAQEIKFYSSNGNLVGSALTDAQGYAEIENKQDNLKAVFAGNPPSFLNPAQAEFGTLSPL